MFNWLQHLFTVRALERELADARLKIEKLQSELDEANRVITVKEEELGRIKHDLDSFKKFHSSKPLNYPSLGGGLTKP